MGVAEESRAAARAGRVEAVLVGRAVHLPADGAGSPVDRPWHTAIFKSPVAGAVALGPGGLVGDEHADTSRHGGRDKAVLCFAREHYPHLAATWGLSLIPGAFGENLLVRGLTEETVCIGDLWRVGSAAIRVTQPRQPAWKLARRWHRTRLPKALAAAAMTGWYGRTVEPGEAWAGAEIVPLERPLPGWSVRRAVEVLYSSHRSSDAVAELLESPFLGPSWRSKILTRYGLCGSGHHCAKNS